MTEMTNKTILQGLKKILNQATIEETSLLLVYGAETIIPMEV